MNALIKISILTFLSLNAAASEISLKDESNGYLVTYSFDNKKVAAADRSLLVTGYFSNEKKWELHDFVKSCSEDPVLEVIDKSRSFGIDSASNDVIYYFAYRIGCTGGIEPAEIKYFAFIDKQKHVLRGEETIICDDGKFGGEVDPIPNPALKSKPALLDFMLKKWRTFSSRKCGSIKK